MLDYVSHMVGTQWYIVVHSGTQWYIVVHSGTQWYIVAHSGTQSYIVRNGSVGLPNMFQHVLVEDRQTMLDYVSHMVGTQWYIVVHSGTQWDIVVHSPTQSEVVPLGSQTCSNMLWYVMKHNGLCLGTQWYIVYTVGTQCYTPRAPLCTQSDMVQHSPTQSGMVPLAAQHCHEA